MPKAIWEAAIRLAHRFGVCRIARATGLSYVWLRKKLERSAKSASGAPQEMAPAFLEVPVELLMTEAWKDEGNADRFGPARTLTVVEVSAPDGSRMRIQVGAGSLDAPGIIAAFLGRPH